MPENSNDLDALTSEDDVKPEEQLVPHETGPVEDKEDAEQKRRRLAREETKRAHDEYRQAAKDAGNIHVSPDPQ